jgi:hypothetical protein
MLTFANVVYVIGTMRVEELFGRGDQSAHDFSLLNQAAHLRDRFAQARK